MTKCVVNGCENLQGEGVFVGSFCAPCWTMLTSGEVGFGTTFIHRMKRELAEEQARNKRVVSHQTVKYAERYAKIRDLRAHGLSPSASDSVFTLAQGDALDGYLDAVE